MFLEREGKGKNGLLLGACCVHLLAAVDEALLHGRDALLLLDLFLDLGHLHARTQELFSRPSFLRSVEVIRWYSMTRGAIPCSPARCRAQSPCRSTFAPYQVARLRQLLVVSVRKATFREKYGRAFLSLLLDQHGGGGVYEIAGRWLGCKAGLRCVISVEVCAACADTGVCRDKCVVKLTSTGSQG